MAKNSWFISRRAALGSLAVAATLVAAGTARAQDDKTVYFLTWGGTVQQFLEKEGWNEKYNLSFFVNYESRASCTHKFLSVSLFFNPDSIFLVN